MEKKITIEELYELLCKKFDAMPGLTELYVGITDDIVRRSEEHKKEYMFTQEIAHGTHAIISNAEKYLIKKFKELENIQSILKTKEKEVKVQVLRTNYIFHTIMTQRK